MLHFTVRVQCGPLHALVAMINRISSVSSFPLFPLLFQIPWLSWWSEAPIARPPALVHRLSTIRMEVILSVMIPITTALLSARISRRACHARFKARRSLLQEDRVIWDGHSVS